MSADGRDITGITHTDTYIMSADGRDITGITHTDTYMQQTTQTQTCVLTTAYRQKLL